MASATEPEQDVDSQSDPEEGDPKYKPFLDQLERYFSTSDLYEVLGITDKACDANTLRKAYHKLSIKVHPDRVKPEDREEATHRFQLLGRVYQTLSDAGRRREYDQFGAVLMEDEVSCPDGADTWEQYWRVMYPKILLEEVEKFSSQYRGSESEFSDLKEAYKSCKGSMDEILENMMCSVYTDDERFRALLIPCIESGELPSYDKFVNESSKKRENRKKKGLRESREAKELQEELGIDFENEKSLIAKIQSRASNRSDLFLNSLEDKYSNETKTKKVKVEKKQSKVKSKPAAKK